MAKIIPFFGGGEELHLLQAKMVLRLKWFNVVFWLLFKINPSLTEMESSIQTLSFDVAILLTGLISQKMLSK